MSYTRGVGNDFIHGGGGGGGNSIFLRFTSQPEFFGTSRQGLNFKKIRVTHQNFEK